MATPTRTLRLRPRLRAEINRIAQRTRRSFSEVAQDLLEEAVRMRECPGVYFIDEPSGRTVKVAGTGLGVWEVIRDYKATRASEKKLQQWLPHLSAAQIKSALFYYGRYQEEIDAEIAEDATLTFDTARAALPGLARRG